MNRVTLEDIRPGLCVQVHCHPVDGRPFTEALEILSEPYPYEGPESSINGSLCVKVKTRRREEEQRFLDDMGVVPYEGDHGPVWNEVNTTVAA